MLGQIGRQAVLKDVEKGGKKTARYLKNALVLLAGRQKEFIHFVVQNKSFLRFFLLFLRTSFLEK